MNVFISSILLLVSLNSSAQTSPCRDSIKLDEYCATFAKNPAFYAADLVPDEEYAAYYLSEINYYNNYFRLKQSSKMNWNIRLWKCSGVYANGMLYEWKASDNEIIYTKYTYNQEYRFKKERISKEVYRDQTLDTLTQWFDEQHFMDFPQQPYEEYLCTMEQDVEVYVLEVFRKGEYRFILYKNPRFYAQGGSCIDQLFLDCVTFLLTY